MHDDAMTHAKWECDNGQMQERYVHYDAEEMFMRSGILPWHRFFYIWRSVTPIGLKPSPSIFPKTSFLVAKVEHQPPYEGPTRGRGAPT